MTFTLEEFLQDTIWNPTLEDSNDPDKKILHMRLKVKPGSTVDNLNITLNGRDLRIDFPNPGNFLK